MAYSNSRACLIISLGTSEPRVKVNGQWLLLKDDAVKEHWPETSDAAGLYEASKGLLGLIEKESVKASDLWFPIVELAIAHAGGELDVYPIVTGDPAHATSKFGPKDPQSNDTQYCGELLKKACTTGKVVMTSSLGAEPTDPRKAAWAVARILREMPLDDYEKVYFCQSPGVPVVNSELTRQLLKQCRLKLRLFQALRPKDTDLVEGRLGGKVEDFVARVPEMRLLGDYLADVIPKLLDKFHYQTALELTKMLPADQRAGLETLLAEGAA